MQLLARLSPLLLTLPALPAQASIDPVSVGSFREWSPRDGIVQWDSGGLHITLAPAPCTRPPQTVGCGEGVNNQARITVAAPGRPAYQVLSDAQATYYRISVVRFDRRDARPGVVIENDSGGSSGDVRAQLLVPQGRAYRQLWLPDGWGSLQGSLAGRLTDISGDGRIDFVLGDGRFAYVFGCGACTPRPPRVFTLRGGALVDVSRERAYAGVYREDMARLGKVCASSASGRNGACAAYAADAARIGRFEAAWTLVQRHHEPGADLWEPEDGTRFRSFLESLHAFLRKNGYIS